MLNSEKMNVTVIPHNPFKFKNLTKAAIRKFDLQGT